VFGKAAKLVGDAVGSRLAAITLNVRVMRSALHHQDPTA